MRQQDSHASFYFISIVGLELMTGTFRASHVIHKAQSLATSSMRALLSFVWRIEIIPAAGGTPPSRWEADLQ